MPTFEIRFVPEIMSSIDKEDFDDDVAMLMSTLRNNGQILTDDYVLVLHDNHISTYVHTPMDNSLNPEFHNEYVLQRFRQLEEHHSLTIAWNLLPGGEVAKEGSYQQASSFLLYYSGFSSLKSMDDFLPIPLYQFPYTYIDGKSHNDINFWERDYEAMYRLWMRGAVDEPRMYQYLSHLNSDLNKNGRAIASRVAEVTGKPCYYYLFNYDSEVYAEKCPSCQEEWRLSEKLFGEFDLLCNQCRIVSNSRVDV